jgi:Ca2+-binding RTX toxin-like protein
MVLLIALMAATLVLASGIALAATFIQCTGDVCWGTSGPDDMCGTSNRDVVYGRGGFDVILADGGDPGGRWGAPGGPCGGEIQAGTGGDDVIHDVIHGGGGPDSIYDEVGNDVVYGGDGDDSVNFVGFVWAGFTIEGENNGNDIISGGNGDDTIAPVGGTDIVFGGRGNDEIYARNGDQDTLSCGEGTDTVFYNEGVDEVVDCEIRHPSSAASNADRPWVPAFLRLR